jgi:flagellar hook-basal body complex protein FliE
MEVPGIRPTALTPISNTNTMPAVGKSGDISKLTESFGAVLENALQSVNNQEKQVRVLNEQFVTGQISDVHTLMIASEKAQLGLQLTVQVRNKVIEAYQEIMRTQL